MSTSFAFGDGYIYSVYVSTLYTLQNMHVYTVLSVQLDHIHVPVYYTLLQTIQVNIKSRKFEV